MAKERIWRKKRAMLWKGIISVLILATLGVFMYNLLTPDKTEALAIKYAIDGALPTENSFLGYYLLLNEKFQVFSFVDVSSTTATQFTKTRDSSYIYAKNPSDSWMVGTECKQGELIRFLFCDTLDKNSCTKDIFAQLWQVHSSNDYPNFNNFYTKDMKFNFAYTCYQPNKIFPDEFERSYLWNGKCVSKKESGGQGTNYQFEQACLSALKKLMEEKQQLLYEEQQRQQKEKLDNLEAQCKAIGGVFDRNTQDCKRPTKQTTTTPTTGSTAGGDYYTGTTDETGESVEVTTTETGTSGINCRAYEEQIGTECIFSFSDLISNEGVADYWEDKPINVIVVIALGLLLIFTIKNKGANPRNWFTPKKVKP